MNCPYCNTNRDKVIDSRSSEGGKVIRRRRECLKCRKRFTTYERMEPTGRLMVLKSDKRREPFDPEKLLRGIEIACGKRDISSETKQRVVEEIEDELSREYDREAPSSAIGERVMAKLRRIDPVALLRFSSEYYPKSTLDDIAKQVEDLMKAPPELPDQEDLF